MSKQFLSILHKKVSAHNFFHTRLYTVRHHPLTPPRVRQFGSSHQRHDQRCRHISIYLYIHFRCVCSENLASPDGLKISPLFLIYQKVWAKSDVQNGAGASPSSHLFLKYSGMDYKYYTMCVSDDVDYEIPICDFELKSQKKKRKYYPKTKQKFRKNVFRRLCMCYSDDINKMMI